MSSSIDQTPISNNIKALQAYCTSNAPTKSIVSENGILRFIPNSDRFTSLRPVTILLAHREFSGEELVINCLDDDDTAANIQKVATLAIACASHEELTQLISRTRPYAPKSATAEDDEASLKSFELVKKPSKLLVAMDKMGRAITAPFRHLGNALSRSRSASPTDSPVPASPVRPAEIFRDSALSTKSTATLGDTVEAGEILEEHRSEARPMSSALFIPLLEILEKTASDFREAQSLITLGYKQPGQHISILTSIKDRLDQPHPENLSQLSSLITSSTTEFNPIRTAIQEEKLAIGHARVLMQSMPTFVERYQQLITPEAMAAAEHAGPAVLARYKEVMRTSLRIKSAAFDEARNSNQTIIRANELLAQIEEAHDELENQKQAILGQTRNNLASASSTQKDKLVFSAQNDVVQARTRTIRERFSSSSLSFIPTTTGNGIYCETASEEAVKNILEIAKDRADIQAKIAELSVPAPKKK